MKKERHDLLPPGSHLSYELIGYGLVLLLMCILSTRFLFAFREAYGSMYFYGPGGKPYLFDQACMENINILMAHCLSGIWIVLVYNLFMAVFHYRSFYGESKSIYVMKRLRDSGELHKRCLTLPILSMVAGIILAALLIILYRYLYYHVTPALCLPEYSPLNIWRMLL